MNGTFIWRNNVINLIIPLEKPMKFYYSSLFVGGVSKYPNTFYQSITPNCQISNFIWYVNIIFSFLDSFDLRKTFMSE